MYEITREPEYGCLVITLQGEIGLEDYSRGVPELEKLVEETQVKRLFLDWTELTGWDKEAESFRFHARREMSDRIERVAVLAERDWDDEIRWAQETFNLQFRRFPPSERQAALEWLGSEI